MTQVVEIFNPRIGVFMVLTAVAGYAVKPDRHRHRRSYIHMPILVAA